MTPPPLPLPSLDDPTVVTFKPASAGQSEPGPESAPLLSEFVVIQSVGRQPLSLADLAQAFACFAGEAASTKAPPPLPRSIADTLMAPTFVVRVRDLGGGKVVIEAQHGEKKHSLIAQ